MKIRLFSAIVLVLSLGAAAYAQDANPAPPAGQDSGGRGYGQRGGRGGLGTMGEGRGLMGTVIAVAADHYTIKSYTGDTYIVHFSANTRIMKQGAGMRGPGGGDQGMGNGMGRGGNPPQPLKPTDIKAGDDVAVMGEVDATAKSAGATLIVLVDPERARQMREMQANYGKTWIMGRVIAIDGVKVTLRGASDNALHAFIADENTTFRKRRDPITLADIQIGDMVRAEGALKDGAFTASTVSVMGMPPGGAPAVPRNAQPQ
jgi:hypothetical protein